MVLELMGPATHSQGLREGRFSPCITQQSRERGTATPPPQRPATGMLSGGRTWGGCGKYGRCKLHPLARPPHSDLSAPSIIPLLQTTPTAAPVPMPFPAPDTPPLGSVSKHPRGSFLERMRPRASEVLARPQERNSAVSQKQGALTRLPPLLETLLSCQQPRRRPHLEASRPTPAEANTGAAHTLTSPPPRLTQALARP